MIKSKTKFLPYCRYYRYEVWGRFIIMYFTFSANVLYWHQCGWDALSNISDRGVNCIGLCHDESINKVINDILTSRV